MNAVILSTANRYEEFENLVGTLDIVVGNIFIQRRKRPDPRTFFGEGKLKLVKEYLNNNKTDVVLINDVLRPIQHYNLEKMLKVE